MTPPTNEPHKPYVNAVSRIEVNEESIMGESHSSEALRYQPLRVTDRSVEF